MKKIFPTSAIAIFIIALTSSYVIHQKETVSATSSWFYSWTDADSDCRQKLADKGGNSTGDVSYHGREESVDGMKKKIFKTSCTCYKKEKK